MNTKSTVITSVMLLTATTAMALAQGDGRDNNPTAVHAVATVRAKQQDAVNQRASAGVSFSSATETTSQPNTRDARAPMPCGPISLTHSSSNTIASGNSVSCNSGGLHTNNYYYRAFDFASQGIGDTFNVCQVDIGVELAIANFGGGGTQLLYVFLYDTTDLLDLNSGTLIGQATVNVADQSLSILSVPVTGTTTTGQLTVEIETPDGQAVGNSFYIGSNALPETAPSYVRAGDCGLTVPTPTADIGFPDMHIVMTVHGDADCNNNNVPDAEDIANNTSEDCNNNLIPDECEVAPDLAPGTGNVLDCANGIVLAVPTNYTVTIATPIPLDLYHCGLQYSFYGLWTRYRAAWSGTAFIGITTQNAPGMINVYDWCPSGGGMQIACNSPNPNGVTFHVERGRTYYIRFGIVGNPSLPFQMSGHIVGPRNLGSSNDYNVNGIPDDCDCLFDVNNDNVVDFFDFLEARQHEGMCTAFPCTGDVDGNGSVDEVDYMLILQNVGLCPVHTLTDARSGHG